MKWFEMDIKKSIIKEDINAKENLVLFQNTKFIGNIKCKNIICKNGCWSIDAWDIDAKDINVWNIRAWNVNANNILATTIDTGIINAHNINARVILCEKRIKKNNENKTIAKVFVDKIGEKEQKEQVI